MSEAQQMNRKCPSNFQPENEENSCGELSHSLQRTDAERRNYDSQRFVINVEVRADDRSIKWQSKFFS